MECLVFGPQVTWDYGYLKGATIYTSFGGLNLSKERGKKLESNWEALRNLLVYQHQVSAKHTNYKLSVYIL